MSELPLLPDVLELSPDDEARRLWRGALEARGQAERSLVALCELLDLGLRAAEILVIQRLQAARERFPATILAQLELPEPEVDIERDAIAEPRSLGFTDVLDLLSAEELDCVAPRLHRGWEDRRFSCRRSRATAREAIGLELDAEERDQLLLLAAYRNRLLREPPPVRIEPRRLLNAFPALERVVETLLED